MTEALPAVASPASSRASRRKRLGPVLANAALADDTGPGTTGVDADLDRTVTVKDVDGNVVAQIGAQPGEPEAPAPVSQ